MHIEHFETEAITTHLSAVQTLNRHIQTLSRGITYMLQQFDVDELRERKWPLVMEEQHALTQDMDEAATERFIFSLNAIQQAMHHLAHRKVAYSNQAKDGSMVMLESNRTAEGQCWLRLQNNRADIVDVQITAYHVRKEDPRTGDVVRTPDHFRLGITQAVEKASDFNRRVGKEIVHITID